MTEPVNVDELAAQVEEVQAVQDRLWQTVTALRDEHQTNELGPDLAGRLDELDDLVSGLSDELRRQQSILAHLQAQKRASEEPQFPTLHAWVAEQFLACLEREPGMEHTRWCEQWWAHPEASAVLEAMWRAWEHARHRAGAGDSSATAWWLREVFLPLGPGLLLSGTGPFSACAHGRHHHLDRLPTTTPPAELVVSWDNTPNGKTNRRRRKPRRASNQNALPLETRAINGQDGAQ